MVAKVITGKSIRSVISYNENKVKSKVAEYLLANQFGCEIFELNFHQKLNRFQKLMERNPKTRTNAVHISLNFDIAENVPKEILIRIANTYMEKIGFGDQPYLVYQHHDAAHPHLHIVTTNIGENGQRIDLHNIGRNQSEKARKEIEDEFHLVQAESKKRKWEFFHPIDAKRTIYGRSETKRSISNAVRIVATTYKYTSFPEFNAALRQFNVLADKGAEGTKMFSKKGLLYRLLDEKGNKIGVPVKASSIYGKPTLPFLEKQFAVNGTLREPLKKYLRQSIDHCLRNTEPPTLSSFSSDLQKKGIYTLLRQSVDGKIYGITFVDNRNKTVFNGNDLGKSYGAKALLEILSDPSFKGSTSINTSSEREIACEGKFIEINPGIDALITDLISAQQTDFSSPPYALKKLRRKKKKRRNL